MVRRLRENRIQYTYSMMRTGSFSSCKAGAYLQRNTESEQYIGHLKVFAFLKFLGIKHLQVTQCTVKSVDKACTSKNVAASFQATVEIL